MLLLPACRHVADAFIFIASLPLFRHDAMMLLIFSSQVCLLRILFRHALFFRGCRFDYAIISAAATLDVSLMLFMPRFRFSLRAVLPLMPLRYYDMRMMLLAILISLSSPAADFRHRTPRCRHGHATRRLLIGYFRYAIDYVIFFISAAAAADYAFEFSLIY